MTLVDDALSTVVAALGGSRRDGQHVMANAVAHAMAEGEHLVVEAGTGTGKSLGYLVPAVVRAAAGPGEHGENRTVVATATLALQRQLVDHDLPAAVHALAGTMPRTVTFAVSKGRHNYVCLDKYHRDATTAQEEDGALFEAPTSHLGRQAKKLRAWIESTATGDRDDYPHDLDARLWRSVAVSGRECVGAAKCVYGERCFAESARATANSADIVITNHALLVLDVIEGLPILPEHGTVIVDEAHELVDRTTSALAGSLDVVAIERASRLARKYVDVATYDRLLESGDDLGRALGNLDDGAPIVRLEEVVGTLHTALTSLRDVAKAAIAQVGSSSQDDAEVAAAKKRAKAEVQDILNITAALLSIDEYSVAWVNLERTPTLHCAPLSVAEHLRDTLFGQRTVVMTSATLQVNGTLDGVARAVGLGETGWRGLDVGSPFDYARQGILYCNPELPAPTASGIAAEALDELAMLVDAAGGRTLALFSSWRGVERAAEYLQAAFRGRDDRPLIVAARGDGVSDLVRRFREQPHATLLGTVSLWQGIDVPGDTCTLVTIDRLPFPRPDDPVMSARAARVDAAGGNGFTSVQVPRAALLLAQGVGRLIRSADDRGVVAILDSRFATKGYGATMRKSLPPLWYTTDTAVVLNSLRNLDAQASNRAAGS